MTPDTPTPPASRLGARVVIFLLVCVSLIWFGLGSRPLNGRSEGRYAVVSMNMANGSGLLVPIFRDNPHLTKPPLTYWLEAACIRIFGENEWAVRLPCATAGSLTVLLLFWFATKTGTLTRGVLATGVLAVMPMHLILSRLTLTDALLGLFWFASLAFAYLAITDPVGRRWPALLWVAVALGLLTKGPLAWVPVAIVLLWLAAGSQFGKARALRIPTGFVLSAIPLMIWVLLIWRFHPKALEIWNKEMVDRATGHGDHNEPFWFFIPIFLAGLFPATAMMNLPWLNYPYQAARDAIRRAEPACLWAYAVVLPFLMFSAIRGKLPSYLLPLCPPMALLTADMLERWLDGRSDTPEPGHRPPLPAHSLLVVSVAVVVGGFVGVGLYFGFDQTPMTVPLVMLVAASAWATRLWKVPEKPRRAKACVILFVSIVLCWLIAFTVEIYITAPQSNIRLIAHLEKKFGVQRPLRIALYRFEDDTMTFYNERFVPSGKSKAVLGWVNEHPSDLIVLAKKADWERYSKQIPALAEALVPVGEWDRELNRQSLVILRPNHPEAMPSTQPAEPGTDDSADTDDTP